MMTIANTSCRVEGGVAAQGTQCDRISVTRYWLEKVLASLQGPLPSGHIGDVAFLLRDQVKDILDTAPTSPSSEPVAWRWKYNAADDWRTTDVRPFDRPGRIIEPLYAHQPAADAEREALGWPSREVVAREIRGAMLDNPTDESFNKRAEKREAIANDVADVIIARFNAASLSPVRSSGLEEASEALRHADIDLSMILPEVANSEMRASMRKTLDMIDRARAALNSGAQL